MLCLGIFCAFALRIAVRRLGFISGSGLPALAAIVMMFPNFGNNLDIAPHLFNFDALRYSNALPILVSFYLIT